MKILDKLDKFFESQKESEQKIIFLLTAVIMFFIGYYFLYPNTDEMFDNIRQKNLKLNNEIYSKQQETMRIKNAIIKISKEKKDLERKIKELSKSEIIMKNLLEKVKFLIFNLNRWAEIYNTIPKYVSNSNLLLLKLDNELFLDDKSKKDNKLVNLKMQLKLKVIGDFRNIVKLINIFESRKDLVKVVYLKTDGVVTFIVVNIYGAEL
jgi:cell division protein FtsL